MLIAYIVKPVNTDIEDNIVILITMISILSLFMDYIRMRNLYGRTLIKMTRNIENGLHIGIKNITNKMVNKKDK